MVEINERDQLAANCIVLDDPLRILLAERRLPAEGMKYFLARGIVDDYCRAAGERRSGDNDGDGISLPYGDASEVVCVIRVPLVPG